jgi:hypothetical protein
MLLDLLPSGETPLAETALGAFYLGSQRGTMDLFDFVDEAFHTVVGMNQVGEGLTQIALVGPGEFTQHPISVLVNFDLPYHAVKIPYLQPPKVNLQYRARFSACDARVYPLGVSPRPEPLSRSNSEDSLPGLVP